MTHAASARLEGLYRYPVKGLSPEPMQSVALEPGQTVPFDRAYAIENGPGRFDPDDPQHLPKINFLMLVRNERLATLATSFDADTHTLTILRDGKQVARGQLSTTLGRKMIEQFVAAYMKDDLRGAPKIMHAEGHSFSDVAAKCLHIISLTSLRELERVVGTPLSPLRFRPNMVVDGLEPFTELSLVGQTIKVGPVELEVIKRTERCAATDVDPDTGARDTAIPAVLLRTWGHSDFGVYARVTKGGTATVGDTLTVT